MQVKVKSIAGDLDDIPLLRSRSFLMQSYHYSRLISLQRYLDSGIQRTQRQIIAVGGTKVMQGMQKLIGSANSDSVEKEC